MLRKKAGFVGSILLVILLCAFFYLLGQGRLSRKINRAVYRVERNKTFDLEMAGLKTELYYYDNWFDSISVISTWLFQNTRIGNQDCYLGYNFGEDVTKWYDTLKHLDAKWFWEVNSSDTVASYCGEHSNFAIVIYKYFQIKAYNLSIMSKRGGNDGHMINVVLNPHNGKWYPLDHFFGLRWKYNGEWLDMKTYYRLSKSQLCSIDVEHFGTYKYIIQETPFAVTWNYCYDPIEVVLVERSNSRYYRIVAPFTLRKTFSEYKPVYDSIAASYSQPPHVDWIDLARRLPMYSAKVWSPFDLEEQSYADSLLSLWKQ